MAALSDRPTRVIPANEAQRLLSAVSGEEAPAPEPDRTAVASLRARRLRRGGPRSAVVPARGAPAPARDDTVTSPAPPRAVTPPPPAATRPAVPLGAGSLASVERACATRAEPAREGRRPAPEPRGETRKIERRRAWNPDGVTLLAAALHKGRASELVALLSEGLRGGATSYLNHLLSLDSAGRKARLARDFGERNDGSVRIRAVFAALPGLEHEIWHCLPEHHRRSYPELATPTRAADAQRFPVVERLVKEALR